MAGKPKRKWIANLFPVEHDFFAMLDKQAQLTLAGIESLAEWLNKNEDLLGLKVLEKEQEADRARHAMEDILVDAFSTPIDRGDLYELSKQMDQIVNYAKSTVREASALDVLPPQPHFERFATGLRGGTVALAAAVHLLGEHPEAAEDEVPKMRAATKAVREAYFDCLHDIATERDVNLALRRREVYHHLKDAGVQLDRTADVLHRIIVRVL